MGGIDHVMDGVFPFFVQIRSRDIKRFNLINWKILWEINFRTLIFISKVTWAVGFNCDQLQINASLKVNVKRDALTGEISEKMSVKKYVCVILVILSISVKSSLGKKKPADHYFDLCHRNDPKINDCITKTLQKATPKIVAGMPEIGIPLLDPLRIDNVTMVEGSGNFQLYFSMDNVTVKGLTNLELQTFSIDLKNESNTIAKFDVKVPWLHFKGKYIMDGKLLLVPVQGNGDFYLNITQPYLKATLNWHTRINPKNNKKYVRVDSFKWDFVIKGAKVHFYNLFNGNKLLGETVNKFLQDNAVELFSIIKHLPAEAFGALYISVVNDFFNRFTYDELFLP